MRAHVLGDIAVLSDQLKARDARICELEKEVATGDENEIDLATAVDVAIRDLREIREKWGEAAGLHQAEACLNMLERAFYNAT